MLIYMLLNVIEERAYVGQTVQTLAHHTKEHWDAAHKGDTSILHAAMRKWDEPWCWTCVVLQNCYNQEQLDASETWWINELCTREPGVGYNARPGTFKRSPKDARAALTDQELDFYRECGKKGAAHGIKGTKRKEDMTEEEREKYRAWGRKGAEASRLKKLERP